MMFCSANIPSSPPIADNKPPLPHFSWEKNARASPGRPPLSQEKVRSPYQLPPATSAESSPRQSRAWRALQRAHHGQRSFFVSLALVAAPFRGQLKPSHRGLSPGEARKVPMKVKVTEVEDVTTSGASNHRTRVAQPGGRPISAVALNFIGDVAVYSGKVFVGPAPCNK